MFLTFTEYLDYLGDVLLLTVYSTYLLIWLSSLFIFSVSIHIQLARFAGVLIPVECEEEEPVETAVEHDHEVHPHRVATGGVYQRDQAVDKDDQELDHLHGGQVFLPPEVLLEPGARRGQEVVWVHDDVDQGVPHPWQEI